MAHQSTALALPQTGAAELTRPIPGRLSVAAWRWPVAAVLALVAYGCLPLLWQRGLWFDEAFSWRLTRFSWPEMIERSARDVHPPLYYIALKLWTLAFGDSPMTLRSLSVAWFAVALGAAYLFLRDSTVDGTEGQRCDCGLIAVLLLASSPFLLRYAIEARMYAQLVALLILSGLTLLRATTGLADRIGPWLAYSLTGAAMAYTHYIGIFSLASQAAFVVGLAFVRAGGRIHPMLRSPLLRYGVLSYLLMLLLYAPWIPSLLSQQAQVAEDYWAPLVDQQSPIRLELWRQLVLRCVLHDRAELAGNYEPSEVETYVLGFVLLVGAALLLLLLTRQGRAGWLVAFSILGPIDLALVNCYRVERNLIEHRYLICSFGMLLLGLALLIGRLRDRPLRWLFAYGVSLNLLFCALNLARDADVGHRPEFSAIASRIAERAAPSDLIISLNPVDFFPMKYHARNRFVVRQLLNGDQIVNHYNGSPIFRDADFIDEKEITRNGPGKVWLVGRSADIWPEGRGLCRISTDEFPEAIRWRGLIMLTLWDRCGPALSPIPLK